MQGAREFFIPYKLFFSLLKSLTDEVLITTISSYQGCSTRGCALEVGSSSTKAVVYSAVMILFSDYLLAELFL